MVVPIYVYCVYYSIYAFLCLVVTDKNLRLLCVTETENRVFFLFRLEKKMATGWQYKVRGKRLARHSTNCCFEMVSFTPDWLGMACRGRA